jgi:hypothetical protein
MSLDYDADRKEAALRVEQFGMKSLNFEIQLKGTYGANAIIEIFYQITGVRRAYAAGGGETAKNWIGYFLSDLKSGVFSDGRQNNEQYANMQVELMRLQHADQMQKWKSNDERILKKWQDRRDLKIGQFRTFIDRNQTYATSYLKLVSILNGGAVVTILTFAHNMLIKERCAQISLMLDGSKWFICGLVATLLATAIGYWSNAYYALGKRKFSPLFWVLGDVSGILAFGFFCWGAWVALQTVPSLVNCL